jgi:hypothetical protein
MELNRVDTLSLYLAPRDGARRIVQEVADGSFKTATSGLASFRRIAQVADVGASGDACKNPRNVPDDPDRSVLPKATTTEEVP